ncbi:MAG: response regulator [Candidatus Tectomicrobia bacterium]|nr:response regulator [Candidatus Tectomicrobia bacterium]
MAEAPCRILLIDANETLLEEMRNTLTQIGYAVETTQFGYQAIVLCRMIKFDLVVTDSLPADNLTGFAITRELRHLQATTPIVLMIPQKDERDLESFKKFGFAAVLEKPFTLGELLAVVHEVLQRDMNN